MKHKNTKDNNKIFALYDEEDRPLGCYDREQLRGLLNTKNNQSFDCIMSKLRTGYVDGVYYKGKFYKVYIYDEGN